MYVKYLPNSENSSVFSKLKSIIPLIYTLHSN